MEKSLQMAVFGDSPELRDVLELLYTARSRFRTIRLELRAVRNPRAEQEATQRFQTGGARVGQVVLAAGEVPERTETVLHVAAEPPARWRVEREDAQGSSLTVVDGDTWWMYHPAMGAITNHGDPDHQAGTASEATPLLDPSPLLATLELTVAGVNEEGIELKGRRRRDVSGPWDHLSFGADEHRLLVHRERGVLLRAVSLAEGTELSRVEVVSIEFDVELPAATFTFDPPEGVRVKDARARSFERLSIEEAVERASFAVFVLTGLEDGWYAHAMYIAPEEGEEILHLTYARHDAFRHVNVAESGTAAGWTAFGPVEWRERDGYRFVEADDQAVVVFERGGTHLHLASNELSADELIALADGMERAEGPPAGGPSQSK